MDSLRQLPKLSSLPVRRSTVHFQEGDDDENNVDGDCVFLFHCGFNGNACRLSISKCHLVEKRRFDRFGLYQVDKMVINPL